MNVSRVFTTAATSMAVLAAIGCTSTQPAPEVAKAPMAAPPVQVMASDTMPSQPIVQSERAEVVVARNDAPVVMTEERAMATPAATFTERAPKADRN